MRLTQFRPTRKWLYSGVVSATTAQVWSERWRRQLGRVVWMYQGWIRRCSLTLRRTWLGFGSARVQARSRLPSFTTQGPSWSLKQVWLHPIRPSKRFWSARSRMSLFLGMLRNKEALHPVDQVLFRFPLKTTQQMSVYNAFQLHSTSGSILSVDLAQINLSQKEVNH